VSVCRSALSAVIRHDEADARASTTTELQLERVCHQIGTVTTRSELRDVLEPIRALLEVDEVILSLLTPDRAWVETVVTNGKDEDDRFLLAEYPATAIVLETGEAMQILASDPDADPAEVRLLAEMGYRSLLMVPLLAGARSIGVLEACAAEERPWSRTHIHSTRILGYQLAHVLERAQLLEP
jgi:GAF domain-containing protein